MELDIIKALEEDEIIKSWSTDLMKKHPGGGWITIKGAKVFLGASGNIVAGPKEVKERLNEGKKGKIVEGEETKKLELKNTFSENFRERIVSVGGKKGLKSIKGETKDGYWINADENKDGTYDVMMGKRGKDVGGAGTSMNMFYSKTISKDELKNLPLEIDKHKKPEKKKDSKFQLKHFIGDEGMFRGGEFKIVSHQSYPNRYTIQELDENGKSIGKPDTINQKDFEASFSKFPKEESKKKPTSLEKETQKRLDSSKKRETYQKKGDDGLDQFRELARKSKDVEDFMNKVRNIKDVPASVGMLFMSKYGDGGKSIQEASKQFIEDTKKQDSRKDSKKVMDEERAKINVDKIEALANLASKDMDKKIVSKKITKEEKSLIEAQKLSKKTLDYETTEGINELHKNAAKLDNKYLSTKTKNKLNELVHDLYIDSYIGDLKNGKEEYEDKLKNSGSLQESLKIVSKLNTQLVKEDAYAMEDFTFESVQKVISEALQEQAKKKTTEALQYKMFKGMEPDIIKALGGIEEDNFTEYQETIMKGFDLGVYDEDMLEKAVGHKYFKREGSPGKYKYYYTEAQYKKEKEGGSDKKDSLKVGDSVREISSGWKGKIVDINEKQDSSQVEMKNTGRKSWIANNALENDKEQGGKVTSEGKTNTEKAQFHREQMAIANKKGDGSKYHFHMGKRDMYKKMAEKDKKETGKSVGSMIQMFKDEPKLKITKVHEWGDKGNTYDLESSDGKIKRNNISGTKFI